MSVQIKGVGTIGGIDQGLNVVGVITASSLVGTGVSIVGVVTATSFVGNLTGNATSADTVDTTSSNNNLTHYLTFVDSSGSQSGETLRTYTNLTVNPNSGALSATSFVGSGANLTNLNASNIASGTVPTARLGSGTANNSTFLRGDSTFATVSVPGGAYALNFNDDIKTTYGTGNDFEIWHSSNSNSYIKNSTGELKLASDNIALMTADQSEKFIDCNGNGNVELYHDNRLRAYTVSNGFYVEQSELNDDVDILLLNKSTSLGDNQKSQIACRVIKDAGGSHGGGNRSAVFGHNYNSSTGGGGFYNIRSNDGTNRDFYMDNNTNLRVNYGASNIGSSNGTVVGSQSSDIRNKNLVGDGSVSYGLSEILQLNPIKYQYKKELVDRIGFSAQQVEPIIPESVYDTGQDQDNEGNTVSGDTIKAMYYVDLIPVLVNGIKELKAENDALKARVTTLEGS